VGSAPRCALPGRLRGARDHFGEPDDHPHVRADPDYEELTRIWGSADLHLYDTHVAGHISTILGTSGTGAAVLADARPDTRLRRYFDACAAEADDEAIARSVAEFSAYYERLNEMVILGRQVERR
jgi:hypothetical protein